MTATVGWVEGMTATADGRVGGITVTPWNFEPSFWPLCIVVIAMQTLANSNFLIRIKPYDFWVFSRAQS